MPYSKHRVLTVKSRAPCKQQDVLPHEPDPHMYKLDFNPAADEESTRRLIHLKEMISMRPQIVFVYDHASKSYFAKQTITNNIPYPVSYIVRASKPEFFKVRPTYSMAAPGGSLEIFVKTRHVEDFEDVLGETFSIYAVPLYDPMAREMEAHHINVMWQSIIERKRKFLACSNSSPDLENVCFYLPQDDEDYFGKIPLTGRSLEICLILTKDTPFCVTSKDQEETKDRGGFSRTFILVMMLIGICLALLEPASYIFCVFFPEFTYDNMC